MKFPATMVPRRPEGQPTAGARARATTPPLATPVTHTATPGTTAARAPAIPGAPNAYQVAAAAMTASAEIVLAPELVLILVAGVGGALIWRYMTREQARSLQDPLATPLPPPLPANPGLVPPPMVPDRLADVGFPQAPPVPDLLGQPQADPLPHLLSTPAPDRCGPGTTPGAPGSGPNLHDVSRAA